MLIVMKMRWPLGKLVDPGCSVTRRIWLANGRGRFTRLTMVRYQRPPARPASSSLHA